jgi:hypothetical protein
MLNLENLKNAKLLTEPWEHLLVDNILEKEIFEQLVEEFKKITPKLIDIKRNKDGWWPNELADMGISSDIINIIMKINRQILENSNTILDKFSDPNRSNIGYYSVPRYNFTPPFDRGQIHDDGEVQDKSMIMIIYLYPEKTHGTCLYKEKDLTSLVKEVPWNPNRAMIFAPRLGKTWHDFKANDVERFTMNFYYEKLEHSDCVNNFDSGKMSWFYQAMGTDNLMIELKND